jgi:hypothetical protein
MRTGGRGKRFRRADPDQRWAEFLMYSPLYDITAEFSYKLFISFRCCLREVDSNSRSR